MVVSREYLLRKPAGPSAPKLFLDTQVVPLAVNAAGRVEVALDRAAARTGLRPAAILGGAAGAAPLGLAGLALARWRGGKAGVSGEPGPSPVACGQAAEASAPSVPA